MSLARYVLVQLFVYAVDMGLFLILAYGGNANPISANVVAKITAGFVAFFGHRSYTFRLERHQHRQTQIVRYFILLGLNIPLSSAVLWLILQVTPHMAGAKFISDVGIVLINFWLSRNWVYKERRAE